jgi:ferredoxin
MLRRVAEEAESLGMQFEYACRGGWCHVGDIGLRVGPQKTPNEERAGSAPSLYMLSFKRHGENGGFS